MNRSGARTQAEERETACRRFPWAGPGQGLAPVAPESREALSLHDCLFSQHLLPPCRSVVLKKESETLRLRW